MNATKEYPWAASLVQAIAHTNDFEQLASVGISHLKSNLGTETHIVSGPISPGGQGNKKSNLARLKWTTDALSRQFTMFDHLPFEDKIAEFVARWRRAGGKDYCWDIMDIFYARLFESGYIIQVHFMPDWQSSTGARHERKMCQELGIRIVEIPQSFYSTVPLRAVMQ